MESSSTTPVFISGDQLEALLKENLPNLKILNVNCNRSPGAEDDILLHYKAHIPT